MIWVDEFVIFFFFFFSGKIFRVIRKRKEYDVNRERERESQFLACANCSNIFVVKECLI